MHESNTGAAHNIIGGAEEGPTISPTAAKHYRAANVSWDLNDEQCFCWKRSAGHASWEKGVPLNKGQTAARAQYVPRVVSCVRQVMCVGYWWHGER